MGKILIFGDSIVYGKWDSMGGWASRLRNYIDSKYNLEKRSNLLVYKMGIPGEISFKLVERIENEIKPRIDPSVNNLVLIAIGVNDSCPNNRTTGKQTSEIDFKDAIKKMIEIAQKYNCKVALVGITPVNAEKSKGLEFTSKEAKKYDNYLSEVAEEKSVLKLELFDDLTASGFAELLVDSAHPNDEGHQMIADKIIYLLTENDLINYCISN